MLPCTVESEILQFPQKSTAVFMGCTLLSDNYRLAALQMLVMTQWRWLVSVSMHCKWVSNLLSARHFVRKVVVNQRAISNKAVVCLVFWTDVSVYNSNHVGKWSTHLFIHLQPLCFPSPQSCRMDSICSPWENIFHFPYGPNQSGGSWLAGW